MYVKIRGRRWRIRWLNLSVWGWCVYRKSEIQVAHGQTGLRLAETLIHESLHAAMEIVDEAVVTEVARDIVVILDRNGLLNRGESK